MAKFNGLFGKLRGKYGGGVFAVTKGQNIFREYNGQPANPRSYAQQAQRALLANMTKFYKRGRNNFYKFAFEDKTTRESDFNAFARNNMQKGTYMTRGLYDNPAAPALGEFMLTKGSISHTLALKVVGDMVVLNVKLPNSMTTVGQISAYIISSQGTIQQGDIFTLVFAESDLVPGNTLLGNTPPSWETVQFYLDPNDATTLSSLGLAVEEDPAGRGFYWLTREMNAVDRASFAALTISRNTDSGLKVSNTEMNVSPAAAVVIDWNRGTYARQQAAVSWGGNPEAFLQGGDLSTLPVVSAVTIVTGSSPGYSFGLGTLKISANTLILAGSQVTGQNLRTTAQGGKWEFVWYDATQWELDEVDVSLVVPRMRTTLTATGTATSIALAGSIDYGEIAQVSTSMQGYGMLVYDGTPIWYGVCTVSE